MGKILLTCIFYLPMQRRWQLRGALQVERTDLPYGRGSLGSSCYLSELLHHRCHLLPLRSADLHYEVRLVDLQWRSGLAGAVQQQELCGSFGLLEIRHMGHHRSARLSQCVRRRQQSSDRDRHHILHHNQTEDTLLHGQLDSAHGVDFIPLRACLLPPRRGRRKGEFDSFIDLF